MAASASSHAEQDAILRDHAPLGCSFLLAEWKPTGGNCLVVYKKVTWKRAPFVQLLHISAPGIFAACLGPIALRIALDQRTPALMASERLLGPAAFAIGWRMKRATSIIVRAETQAGLETDDLYNESIALGIPV